MRDVGIGCVSARRTPRVIAFHAANTIVNTHRHARERDHMHAATRGGGSSSGSSSNDGEPRADVSRLRVTDVHRLLTRLCSGSRHRRTRPMTRSC